MSADAISGKMLVVYDDGDRECMSLGQLAKHLPQSFQSSVNHFLKPGMRVARCGGRPNVHALSAMVLPVSLVVCWSQGRVAPARMPKMLLKGARGVGQKRKRKREA